MDLFWQDKHRQPEAASLGLVEWTRTIGSDFDHTGDGRVIVYRECCPVELERIRAKGGMSVTPLRSRPAGFREEMALLDEHRPAALVERGVSRLKAIYAAPAIEDVPRLPFRAQRCVLAAKVDPADCYVGDMSFIAGLIPFIGVKSRGLDEFRGAFRKYWDGVIRLEEFLAHYRPEGAGAERRWSANSGTPAAWHRNYYLPEIMVMTPLIGAERLKLVG